MTYNGTIDVDFAWLGTGRFGEEMRFQIDGFWREKGMFYKYGVCTSQ